MLFRIGKMVVRIISLYCHMVSVMMDSGRMVPIQNRNRTIVNSLLHWKEGLMNRLMKRLPKHIISDVIWMNEIRRNINSQMCI